MEYLPIVISALLLLFAILTFAFSRSKDHDTQTRNNVEINVKLDQVCNNTNNILIEQKRQEQKIQQLETTIAVINNDVKTAFRRIDELKGELK